MSEAGREPSITVAICTFNGERFLAEQLRSIISQTRRADEIILLDDASTDETVSAARSLFEEEGIPSQVIVNQARLGPYENFLRAVELARSDLVAFCDQDDVWAESKLERVCAAFRDPETTLVIHNAMMTDARLAPIGRLDQGIRVTASFNAGELDPYVGPSAGWGNCMTFRRSTALAVDPSARPGQPGEERLLSHDTWIYVLCAALGRVTQLADDLILYRQHGANVTDSQLKMRVTWNDRFADPSPIFLRRAEFYRQCADALQTASPRAAEGGVDDCSLKKAVELYRLRTHFWSVRARVYTGSRRRERFAAFIESQRLAPLDNFRSHLRLSTRLKELINLLVRPAGTDSTTVDPHRRAKSNGVGLSR